MHQQNPKNTTNTPIIADKNIEKTHEKNQDAKPIIGLTIGDYNGIGTEIILKTLIEPRILQLFTPVIYGSIKIIQKYRKILQMPDLPFHIITKASQANPRKINIFTVQHEPHHSLEVETGKLTTEAGEYAVLCLQQATNDIIAGEIQGIVTAPIHKNNTQSEAFPYAGHTEYLAKASQSEEHLMILHSENMCVSMVTTHIPVAEVSGQLTRDKIQRKINLLINTLKNDFNISKPRIAVLGLNPHAGDGGVIGGEETQIIEPVVEDFRKKGQLVFGAFSPDAFFGRQSYKKYDAVLGMYHDQVLIPFKMLNMENGVNFTAGLPFVRTSPDHGTAFDIAGKNIADETSFRQAIFLALDIIKSRKQSEKF
jgi:4-hydroxythreonine-4-phosphate dehydrogenase